MSRTVRGLLLALVALSAAPAAAVAQAPPGPPGPPPGNGTELPSSPGTAPAFVPAGNGGAIPSAASGPGLLSTGAVSLNRTQRTFTVPLACQADGSVHVIAKPVSRATIARGGYHCAGGRAAVRLTLSAKSAERVAKRHTVAALATIRQGSRTARVSFSLTAGHAPTTSRGFWTDGHLECRADGTAYLAEPDFTTRSPTPVSTRGWIAWYTAAGGWHWLGVSGENANRWDSWTATVSGIAQFHPGGSSDTVPFTWGPVSVPSGQGIYAVGVYEIIYWTAGRPDYQWQYVNAGSTGAAAAGAGNLYCQYA